MLLPAAQGRGRAPAASLDPTRKYDTASIPNRLNIVIHGWDANQRLTTKKYQAHNLKQGFGCIDVSTTPTNRHPSKTLDIFRQLHPTKRTGRFQTEKPTAAAPTTRYCTSYRGTRYYIIPVVSTDK